MVSTTTIRRLDIRATTQGVTESTKQLADLSKTHNAVAVATDKSAQRQLSAAGAYDKLLKSVDDNYRSQQRLASGQAILDRAFQQGLITAQEQARAMDLLREKYGTTAQAANDNAEGFRINSEEALRLGGHLKTVAVAAYTLSPAFRQLVNPAIAAGLRTTGGAISAMSPAATTVASAVASRMVPALGLLTRIAIPLTIVSETIRAMGEITELGARKIEEFSKLSKDAYAAGVTMDFFLRQAESARQFVSDADQATAALKRFREVTTDRLGGSEFGNRLGELTKAGNFTGNSGVEAYRQAVTTEERYRAVVKLISEAMERGERLAAIDLAGKFLPPEMTQRLRENGQLLREMQETADRIKPAQLASAEDIGYANELKRRMEEAQKIIENGLKPLQRDLTQLGLNYQETWVNVTEIMAKAVTLANQLYDWLKSIPAFFASMGNSPIWGRITAATDALGLNSKPAWISDLDKPGAATADPGGAGNARLAAMLSDTNAVKKAMQEVIDIQTRVRGEMSKPISSPTPAAKAAQEATDAVDRMLNALNRSIEMQKADAAAVGLGARALAEYRAQAQYNAAVTANGGKVTQEQIDKFNQLRTAAGDAAAALEKARENYQQMNAIAGVATNALNTIVDGFIAGKNAGEVFLDTLGSIGKGLQNIGSQNLQKGLTQMLAGGGMGGFDPASLAIGAAGAGISYFVERQSKLKKARDEWAKTGPAFEAFIETMTETGVAGKVRQAMSDALRQTNEYVRMAIDAGDRASARRAQEAYNTNAIRLQNQFSATFNATLRGLSDAIGMDSPFLAAVDLVKKQLNDMQAFIDDAKVTFNNDATMVAAARESTQDFMVSLLAGARELSKVENELLRLEGTSAALQGALVDLGMSAEQAAAEIAAGMTAAIQKLRAEFEQDVWRDLNDVSGKRYVNEIGDLIAKTQARLQDATRLGYSAELINLIFERTAQQIVDSAGLTGTAFQELVTLFPQLQGAVTEFTGAAEEEAKRLQEEARRAAEEFQNFLSGLSRNIREFIDNFRGGADTNLSPSARLAAAQSAYNSQLGLAQGGDRDAANGLTQYADRLIDALRAMYGSSSTAQSGINSILNQLEALPGQISSEQYIVNAIVDMKSVLQSAIAANNPTLIAAALSGYFNQLDSNLDDNLTYNELRTALGSNFSSGTWANILSTLDSDGDGQISRLEAIKGSTASTDSRVATSNSAYLSNISAGSSSLVSQTSSMISLLTGIANNTSATAASAGTSAIQNIESNRIAGNNYTILNNLQTMIRKQNVNWGSQGAGGALGMDIGGFWTGGYTGAGGKFDVAGTVHRGEYVFDQAATRMWGPANLDMMARGMMPTRMANDNGAVVAAIRSLDSRLAKIEANTGATVQAVAAVGTETNQKLEQANQTAKDLEKRARTKNRAA